MRLRLRANDQGAPPHVHVEGNGAGLPSTPRLELFSAKPLSNGTVAMHDRRARRRYSGRLINPGGATR